MIIIKDYVLKHNKLLNVKNVISQESALCPHCGGILKCIGTRKRGVLTDTSKETFVIRRLRCIQCLLIHHELPDVIVPFKRYSVDVINLVVSEGRPLVCQCEDSTIARIKRWFKKLVSFAKPYSGQDALLADNHTIMDCVISLVNGNVYPLPK